MKRIGVDAGGTFTDSVLWDDERGLIGSAKVSSNKADPAQAVIGAVNKLGAAAQSSVDFLIHGTTVATNAVLERSGATVGLLCTEGFRDVLELARLRRPPEQVYDLRADAPAPLVRRRHRLEVKERIGPDGQVLTDLDEQTVVEAARVMRKQGIGSIAVCYMHAYANDAHEQRTREILAREMPGVAISISSDVLREFREYERSSATALNAYLSPCVAGYLRRLEEKSRAWSGDTQLWVMQSNGGVASAQHCAELPLTLLLSGPSGGVVAGRYLMDEIGLKNAITIDMGGTSYDVCLLADRAIPMTHERQVLEMPIKTPSVDILTIGAGGGSIGWVNEAGQFMVGPASAAAVPGPACYGRGGTEATVTDANVVLGYIGAGQRLGDEVEIDPDAAHRACERLGRKLGLDAVSTAWGMRQVANAAMAAATHAVSVAKGHDSRDFALIAFGGAGPLHAIDIARDLEIPEVVVPAVPGCLSAFGMVVSDVAHDHVSTHIAVVGDDLEPKLTAEFDRLGATGMGELAEEGIPEGRRDLLRSLEMHYLGEQSSISVPVPAVVRGWLRKAVADFHALHERYYGFCAREEPIGVLNVRLRAIGRLRTSRQQRGGHNARASTSSPEPCATRSVVFGRDSAERRAVPVFTRDTLGPGTQFSGPAIVQQPDSTLLVPPGAAVRADPFGNLIVACAS
jgi:N-methylhydantoinase A